MKYDTIDVDSECTVVFHEDGGPEFEFDGKAPDGLYSDVTGICCAMATYDDKNIQRARR